MIVVVGLVTLLAVASTAEGAALFTAPVGTDAAALGSDLIPGFRSNPGNFGAGGSDGTNFASLQQQQQQKPGQTFFQTVNDNGQQPSGSRGQFVNGFSASSFGVASVQPASVPKYEEHIQVNSGVRPVTTTITNTVTQTHTLRVPSTSDVWVTSVTMMKMPVTQLSTQRSYVPVAANTVTSVIRITKTPIEVVTRTEQIYPTKTLVSVFTRFVTETETVELWQNIVHRATNYEVLTVPVVETQTLLQRLFTTLTVTRVVNITSVQQPLFTRLTSVRSGEVQETLTRSYGR